MSTDINTLRSRLAEAENAKHDLAVGRRASVVVDQNGERVEFQRSGMSELQKYINELTAEIAKANGSAPLNGPIWVWGS